MRSILAGTIGLSLGLGSALAQSPPANVPVAGLGRPIPAATLGRPAAMPAGHPFGLQPAGFRNERHASSSLAPADSAPLLAPIIGSPVNNEELPPPRPLPTDGGPGSVASPVPGPSYGPSYGPAPAPSYGPAYAPVAPGYEPCGPGGACYGDAGYSPGSIFGSYPPIQGNGERFYASADFLLWWVPTIRTPVPLALTSPTPIAAGQLGLPADATIAIGNDDLINPFRLGARFGGGVWFDPCHRLGLDANFFFIGPTSRDIRVNAPAIGALYRPYIVINAPDPPNPALPPAPLPNIPGNPNTGDAVVAPGFIAVRTESFMMGADINARRRLFTGCNGFADALLGFRYTHLDESITITEQGQIDPFNQPGVIGTLSDSFRTRNNFYGPQLGMIVSRQWGRVSADLTLKVAAGVTVSSVEATGTNDFDVAPRNFGLFVQASNAGRRTDNAFSVIPEVGLNLGYQLTPRLKAHLGYTGMYWSNVMRPGDQIDPIVDITTVPTAGGPPPFLPLPAADPHPVVPFRRSAFYAHGINVGLTFKW